MMGKTINKIICDLDGVLAEVGHYPDIGPAHFHMMEMIKKLQRRGYRIVIYTSRDWFQEDKIWDWCNLHGFIPNSIICGKPLGIIIDDLSVNPTLEQEHDPIIKFEAELDEVLERVKNNPKVYPKEYPK